MTDHVLEMDPKHRYRCVAEGHEAQPCNGKVLQSVTTILGRAVPKDLSWHGQTRGVIGVKGLMRLVKYPNVKEMKPGDMLVACRSEGIISDDEGRSHTISPSDRAKLAAVPKYDIARMSPMDITSALKRERLTVNDHRDDAAAGGTVVHKALEDYADKGIIPSAAAVPENKRGSIRGLAKFIMFYAPEFLATEVRVLSLEHLYAGTFDLDARIKAELYEAPKRGGGSYLKLRPSPDGNLRALIDLKTSKWVYPSSHFPQLEAYENGRIEMGMEPTDIRAVLWVNADGDMELVPSTAKFDDFLALKTSGLTISRLDSSWRRPRPVRS